MDPLCPCIDTILPCKIIQYYSLVVFSPLAKPTQPSRHETVAMSSEIVKRKHSKIYSREAKGVKDSEISLLRIMMEPE